MKRCVLFDSLYNWLKCTVYTISSSFHCSDFAPGGRNGMENTHDADVILTYTTIRTSGTSSQPTCGWAPTFDSDMWLKWLGQSTATKQCCSHLGIQFLFHVLMKQAPIDNYISVITMSGYTTTICQSVIKSHIRLPCKLPRCKTASTQVQQTSYKIMDTKQSTSTVTLLYKKTHYRLYSNTGQATIAPQQWLRHLTHFGISKPSTQT